MTRSFLIAAFASATGLALTTPAAAVDRPGMADAGGGAGVTIHRRGSGSSVGDGRAYRDRRRGFDGYGYLAVPEYQGDSAWRPTGFNDWWHERPERSEPRWLRSNNCERQYWTGSGWRC